MIEKDVKIKLSGIALCIITALLAINLSYLVGVGLLGFEKSPLSPIIFAILLGLMIKTKRNVKIPYSEQYETKDQFQVLF